MMHQILSVSKRIVAPTITTTRASKRSFTTPALTTMRLESKRQPNLRNDAQIIRSFHSKEEFQKWRVDIQYSAFRPAGGSLSTTESPKWKMESLDLPTAAPFLHSVAPMADQLYLAGVANATPSSPRDALLECIYPLADNELLRNSVADFSHWSAFRLGKFYELVDALTADVAYRHAASSYNSEEVTLVTAGHYHSRKYARTSLHKDVSLRSYVTQVGRSSLEIRTDVWQENQLVNVCHTMMVALDPQSMKPLSKVGKALPPLVLETSDDDFRWNLANQHQQIRQDRADNAMQLRMKVSAPPTVDEIQSLHQLHRQRALQLEGITITADDTSTKNTGHQLPTVSEYTFRSSRVIFPEQRNVHGKLFGGFVMAEGQSLAQYAATFFAKGRPIIPMGIDEAIFLQPVALGDMVTVTARIVHATDSTCRVLVTVEVRDPAHPSRVPWRSNRLIVVFGGDFSDRSGILPETYQEILMHMDARRRYMVEGPWEEEIKSIWNELAMSSSTN